MRYLLSPIMLIAVFTVSCGDATSGDRSAILNEEATLAIEQEDYPRAISIAGEALDGHRRDNDSLGMANSYYLLARASALSGEFEDAVTYGETGSTISRAVEDLALEYKINNILSWAYFTLGRDFNETLAHQQRQLFLVDTLNDDKAKALVYNNYGYDATVAGTIPLSEAVEYMKFANDYYAAAEGHNGRWYTLMNLTWQHRLMNDLPASEQYGRWSVQQAIADDDRHAIIEANTNLGETLLAQNKVEDAGPYYEQALELSLQEEDRDKFVFDVYYARYLWETGKQAEAIARLRTAVDFLENSEVFYEMLGRAFLSEYLLSTGNTEQAQEQIQIFKNPRANYFSQEARVIAGMVEAQLLVQQDRPEEAIDLIDRLLEQTERSEAQWLQNRLEAWKAQVGNIN